MNANPEVARGNPSQSPLREQCVEEQVRAEDTFATFEILYQRISVAWKSCLLGFQAKGHVPFVTTGHQNSLSVIQHENQTRQRLAPEMEEGRLALHLSQGKAFLRRPHAWRSISVSFPSGCLGHSLKTWSPIESKERLLTTLLQLPYGHEWRRQQNHSEPGDG